MLIIGCDFHPSYEQIAIFDNRTGHIERGCRGEAVGHRAETEEYYRGLSGAVRVGMEACGHYPWHERMLAELGFELW